MALVAVAVSLLRAGGVGARGGRALSAVGERLHASGVLSGSAAATLVREASSILAPARASLAGAQAGQQGLAGGRSDRANGRARAGAAESAQEAAAVREGLAAGVQEGLARLLAEMPPLPSLEDDSGEEAAADGGVGAGAGRGAPGEQEGGGGSARAVARAPGAWWCGAPKERVKQRRRGGSLGGAIPRGWRVGRGGVVPRPPLLAALERAEPRPCRLTC